MFQAPKSDGEIRGCGLRRNPLALIEVSAVCLALQGKCSEELVVGQGVGSTHSDCGWCIVNTFANPDYIDIGRWSTVADIENIFAFTEEFRDARNAVVVADRCGLPGLHPQLR